MRTTDGVESVEVKEGLGDAYNEDTDTFDIMNEEQIAFNSFLPFLILFPIRIHN
jgi:hypothetical protein